MEKKNKNWSPAPVKVIYRAPNIVQGRGVVSHFTIISWKTPACIK